VAEPRRITGLRERPRSRVEIELDGQAWRLVPVDAVVRAGLTVGRSLDRETARALARELRRARALSRAVHALATRDRSRRALDERLARARVPTVARAEAIEALERVGLVDDARAAHSRAEVLAARGYGDAAIRTVLEREGIDAELARRALSVLEPELERARRTAKRGNTPPVTALRRLAARGFAPETISELVGRFADDARSALGSTNAPLDVLPAYEVFPETAVNDHEAQEHSET
jgi:SOS response regulatory protein OraA/RecX